MDKQKAIEILDEASEIIHAINHFNEKYCGTAEIFSVNHDCGRMKIHLGEGGADLVSAIQATTRIYPVNLDTGSASVFIEFEHNDARFWYGEEP